jgi:hypothetical protein
MYDQYNALGKEITQISGSLKKYENEIHKNKSDLGTAKQELDLFNREYGDINNFIASRLALLN